MEPESVMIPLKDFQFIPLPVAEGKEAAGKGIEIEAFPDQHRQSVDGLAEVSGARGEIDPIIAGFIQHNPESARTTPERSAGSKPGLTSMLAVPILITRASS